MAKAEPVGVVRGLCQSVTLHFICPCGQQGHVFKFPPGGPRAHMWICPWCKSKWAACRVNGRWSARISVRSVRLTLGRPWA
jgi:hypothetical protein